MKIGVLALQGDFAAHARALARLGISSIEIRRAEQLQGVDGLIMPGGESTTMLKFITEEGLAEPIKEFARSGRPILGTCAGTILVASRVFNPEQPSLSLIDIDVERNAYGRQIDSFIGQAQMSSGGAIEAVFIRAPKIRRVGPKVQVLARLGEDPVLVRQQNIIASTFHPELTTDDRIHRMLLESVPGGIKDAPL
jgi:5'-phosphate synthase pdxT subunit